MLDLLIGISFLQKSHTSIINNRLCLLFFLNILPSIKSADLFALEYFLAGSTLGLDEPLGLLYLFTDIIVFINSTGAETRTRTDADIKLLRANPYTTPIYRAMEFWPCGLFFWIRRWNVWLFFNIILNQTAKMT